MADVERPGPAVGTGGNPSPAAEVPTRLAVSVDRVAAALLATSALYVVFFGASVSEWLWYALAAVGGSAYLLWRSLRR